MKIRNLQGHAVELPYGSPSLVEDGAITTVPDDPSIDYFASGHWQRVEEAKPKADKA